MGIWHSDTEGISSLAVNYFSELFQSNQPSQFDVITSNVQARIMHEDNLMLTAPVTDGEIQEALFQLGHLFHIYFLLMTLSYSVMQLWRMRME